MAAPTTPPRRPPFDPVIFANRLWFAFNRYLERTIWEPVDEGAGKLESMIRGFLRVMVVGVKGLIDNGLFSKAGALSYATLMGLGPMIAIVVILSTALVKTDPEVQIKRALYFVAPSLQEYTSIETSKGATSEDGQQMVSAIDTLIDQIVQGSDAALNRINTGGSTAFGALGSLILIWVAIQLLTSIETTLNQIWGVRKGRAWGQRVVSYWTFISLGTIMGIGAAAMFSASNIAMMFELVPLGSHFLPVLLALTPAISFCMLTLLLALFYMYFPNTRVRWNAALLGGMLTTALLILNNYLSILYIYRVVSLQSLFGSVGIIPVLMIGLYFFWVFILLGGQLTYAIQNAHVLNRQTKWNQLSAAAREQIALAVFAECAGRYLRCERPASNEELAEQLGYSVSLVNEALHLLQHLNWMNAVALQKESDGVEYTGFQPSRPLGQVTLHDFHLAVNACGIQSGSIILPESSDLLRHYSQVLKSQPGDPLFNQPLDQVLAARAPAR
jgi:membrane protein